MANPEERFYKRRLRSSYLSVVVSVTLVLLMLGTFGSLLLQAENLAKEVRENFTFSVMLKTDAPEADVRRFQKELELSEAVSGTEFISKDEAAAEFSEELGEDFIGFLDYNPLSDVIEIRLNADYVNDANIAQFDEDLHAEAVVSDLVYDKNLISMVNDNIRRLGIILLGITAFLIIISIALINSSIRLSIYSRRFTIKTMQLVGATRAFIQKPFMGQSLRLGLLGGFIAAALLGAVMYYGAEYVREIGLEFNLELFGITALGMILCGILLTWSCTYIAVRKYLNLKTDELY